ncbi:MAG: hypothetical protein ABF792_01570 [Bifidobacterium psychraerophilum]
MLILGVIGGVLVTVILGMILRMTNRVLITCTYVNGHLVDVGLFEQLDETTRKEQNNDTQKNNRNQRRGDSTVSSGKDQVGRTDSGTTGPTKGTGRGVESLGVHQDGTHSVLGSTGKATLGHDSGTGRSNGESESGRIITPVGGLTRESLEKRARETGLYGSNK